MIDAKKSYSLAGLFDFSFPSFTKLLFNFLTIFPFFFIFLVQPTFSKSKESFHPILEIDAGGHTARITDLSFTQDGRYLVSSSTDKTIKIFDVSNGNAVRTLRGQIGAGFEGMIFAIALSKKNNLLAVGGWLHTDCPGECGTLRILNYKTDEVLRLLKGHTNGVLDLAFSSDGKKLISGGYDHVARIWDVESGRSLQLLKGHQDAVKSVAFSKDGTLAITGSHDNSLKLWNVLSGSLIATMTEHADKVHGVAFTPDGRYILSGSRDRTVRLWEGKTGKFIKILGISESEISSLSISPDGKKVLATSGSIPFINNVYSIPGGNQISFFSKNLNTIMASAISPDGKTASTAGTKSHEIFLWDLESGKLKRKIIGNGRGILEAGYSLDGRSIAWGRTDPCPLENCLTINGPLEQSFNLRDTNFSPHLSPGKKISGSDSYSRGIHSLGPWEVRTPTGEVSSTLQIFKNGRLLYEIFRDINSGLKHGSFTLTRDSKKILSGDAFGKITAFDLQTGTKLYDFTGHTSTAIDLAISPDGKCLVSGSNDQTVRLWDIATGKPLLTIFQGLDNEWVAWTPEGFYDASPNGDRYVGWRVNKGYDQPADYYTASQFSRYLHRPDIVRDTLALSSSQKAIQKAGMEHITIADLIQRAPVDVKIASVEVDAGGKSEITVTLGKNKTTVPERITLFVNGAQILSSSQRGLNNVRPGDSLKYSAVLPRKKNYIRVLLENQWAENSAETWVTNPSGKDQGLSQGTLFVHAVGVSRYQNMPQLSTPSLDAVTIANRFKQLEGNIYEKVVVNLLTDENGQPVTTARIESLLNQQVLKAGPQDTTLIFLAGHGVTDAIGNYHFLTAESEFKNLKVDQVVPKPGTSFDWSRLHDVLDKTRGRRMVFVDTCQAGKVLNASQTNIRKLVKDVHDVNAIIYTGTSRQQEGLENSKGGVFTQSIVSGLDGKAEYKNGALLFTALRDYVDRETPKRNSEILDEMYGRGILKVKVEIDLSKTKPDFGQTQQPVAVIPKGMEYLVISRE